jgi:hypothetical protein
MLKISAYEPFDSGFECSIKELADANKLDYLEAQGFIKTLVKLGHAKQVAPRKVEGKKGKPTNVYVLPMCLQVTIYEEVSALEQADKAVA